MGRAGLKTILLDTHAFAWVLVASERLTGPARAAIDGADKVLVSAISVYEIGQKVRLGKWRDMAVHAPRLPELIRERGAHALTVAAEVCLAGAALDWGHRDPFDRIICASALAEDAALISADAVFDGVAGLRRVW